MDIPLNRVLKSSAADADAKERLLKIQKRYGHSQALGADRTGI
jgi:hypothetical protein